MVGTGTGSSTGKKLGLTGLTTGPQGMLGGVLTVAVAVVVTLNLQPKLSDLSRPPTDPLTVSPIRHFPSTGPGCFSKL
jgi:hypothetical protein